MCTPFARQHSIHGPITSFSSWVSALSKCLVDHLQPRRLACWSVTHSLPAATLHTVSRMAVPGSTRPHAAAVRLVNVERQLCSSMQSTQPRADWSSLLKFPLLMLCPAPGLASGSCSVCDTSIFHMQLQAEGKAWWTQLQYDRAVKAGCQFYIRRPATTEGRCERQPEPEHQSVPGPTSRPSTVPAPVGVTTRYASQQSGCRPTCVMSMWPSSAKLPARKALTRQLTNEQIYSTSGSSCCMPASRGNDWSPVHSRPVTRGLAFVQQQPARPDTKHTQHPSLATSVARAQAPHGKPPGHHLKHQRPSTTSAAMCKSTPAPEGNQTAAAAAAPSKQVSAASFALQFRQGSGASVRAPSTQTSAASTQPPSTQTSAASAHLSAAASSDSRTSVQGHAEVKQTRQSAHTPAKAQRRHALLLQQRVKVVSMLHPGPRQHRKQLLEVCLQDHQLHSFQTTDPLLHINMSNPFRLSKRFSNAAHRASNLVHLGSAMCFRFGISEAAQTCHTECPCRLSSCCRHVQPYSTSSAGAMPGCKVCCMTKSCGTDSHICNNQVFAVVTAVH